MSVQYHTNSEMLAAVNGLGCIQHKVTPIALTPTITTLTHTEPSTPDYVIQALTSTSPFGFVTADEGDSVLSAIANLQIRVNEIETQLKVAGILV